MEPVDPMVKAGFCGARGIAIVATADDQAKYREYKH
jgi:hypothetical protein